MYENAYYDAMNFKEMHERAQSAPLGFSSDKERQEGAKARFSYIYPLKVYIVGKIHLFRY